MFCAEVVAEVAACFAPQSAATPVELPVGQWMGVPVGTPVSAPAGSTVWMAESPPVLQASENDVVLGVEPEVPPVAGAVDGSASEGGVGGEPSVARMNSAGPASRPVQERSDPHSNIKVYYPSTYNGGPVDCVILSDSFYYFRTSKNARARPYMEEPVSYTHLRAPRDRTRSRMPSSA